MCSVTLRPQDVSRGHGFDECARRGGEFPVRGGQRVRLQLSQCDVLGLVGVRPVQLGGYAPCAVLQCSGDYLVNGSAPVSPFALM